MPDSIPKRIAARRALRERRRAHVAGAAFSTVLVTVIAATFAMGDAGTPATPQAACPTGAAGPVADTTPAPCPTPTTPTETTTPPATTPTETTPPATTPTQTTPPATTPTQTTPPTTTPTPTQTTPPATTPTQTTPPAQTTPPTQTTTPPEPAPVAEPAAPAADDAAVVQAVADTPAPTAVTASATPHRKRVGPAAAAPKPATTTTTAGPQDVRRRARRTQAVRRPSTALDVKSADTARTSDSPVGEVLPASARAVALAGLADLTPPSLADGDAADWTGSDALLPIYHAAAVQYDVPWSVLAAINEIETGFGKNLSTSTAGAVGWMQFMPSTWESYGVDADGDGVRDPSDPVDAIFAAARYLKASGAKDDVKAAVFSYNHAGWYVAKVLGRAQTFAGIAPDTLNALTERGREQVQTLHLPGDDDGYLAAGHKPDGIGEIMLMSDKQLGARVLQDADVYPCGAQDIEAGRIDRRVLTVLEALAQDGMRPTVSALECGHSLLTSSGNVSEHVSGDAVDIAAINGTPILGHQGPGSIAEKVIRRVLELPGALSPHQIISLMTVAGAPNTLAMADHADHVHVGFRPARRIA